MNTPSSRGDAPDHQISEGARALWRRAQPLATSTWFLSVVLSVFAWPGRLSPLPPQSGLDQSWHAALAMAAEHHLPFGSRVVFTFGPLGFLSAPSLYYAGTSMLSFAFRFGLAAATFAVLLSATRRYVALVVAVPVAYVSGFVLIGVLPTDEAALGIAFALTVDRLSNPSDTSRADWEWMALGSLAGLFALEKLSIGLGIVVLCAIAVWCAPGRRRRALVRTGVPALVIFAVGWFATGNGFSNLLAYARASLQTASGYTAMAYDPLPDHHNALVLAGICAVTILMTAGAYAGRLADAAPVRTGKPWEALIAAPAPLGLLVAAAVTTWVLFKEAFVRQDTHRLIFFASVPLILAGFAFGASRAQKSTRGEPWLTRRHGMNLVVALLIFTFFGFEVVGVVPSSLTDPVGAVGGFVDTALTIALPTRRHDLMANARAQLEATYKIPRGMLARISGQTVAVTPYEQTVAWTYPTVRWDPLPVMQDYAAYTDALDRLDADFVESAKAPRFILRQSPSVTIDARITAFEPPATQVAIACNYREVSANTDWQLLERTRDRCGRARDLGRVTVGFGSTVRVPEAEPGHMVVATFDLHLSLLWHLVDRAYKAPQIGIKVNDAGFANRFVVGSAGNSHMLRPASTLGYSPPFVPPTIDSMTFVCHGGAPCPAHVTITYSSIPLR